MLAFKSDFSLNFNCAGLYKMPQKACKGGFYHVTTFAFLCFFGHFILPCVVDFFVERPDYEANLNTCQTSSTAFKKVNDFR